MQDAFKQLSSESKSNIKSHGSIYKYHTVIIDCTPITFVDGGGVEAILQVQIFNSLFFFKYKYPSVITCLLYTSDAADE